MFGFGFYSFGFTNPETVEKLLAREDLTVEELLDEDNIVQEIKGAYEKFGFYMGHHPEMIKSMLGYIVIEPDEIELDYKKCYKYPFIASEIFYAEIDGVVNAFFGEKPGTAVSEEHEHNEESHHEESEKNPNEENSEMEGLMNPYEKQKEEETVGSPEKSMEEEKKPESESEGNEKHELMRYLFRFLSGNQKLNVTSLGYFGKVVNALLNKRFLETLGFLQKNHEVLADMIRRVGCKTIGDILGRIILMDIPFLEDYNASNHQLFPSLRKKLMGELIKKFTETEDHDELNNIIFIMGELMNKYDRINYSKELMEYLIGLDLNCFFEGLKHEKSNKPSYSLGFLCNLLDFFLVKLDQQTQPKKIQSSDNNEDLDKPPCVEIQLTLFETRIKEMFESNVGLIIGLLKKDPEYADSIEQMQGEKIKPLKSVVMRAIDTLNLMLKMESLTSLPSLLNEDNIITGLWDLMITHQWNNLLHLKIEKLILTLLRSGNLKLLELTFEKAKLLELIVRDMSDLEYVMPNAQGRKIKKGYLGYVTNISNEIVSLALVDPFIKLQLKKTKTWENYEENILKQLNSNNDRYLGGHDPRKPNSMDLKMEVEIPCFELKKDFFAQKLPFYFEQKAQIEPDNDEELEDQEHHEIELDNHDPSEPKKHLNNFMPHSGADHENQEEIEENIDDEPENDEHEDHEPFCLKDHLEIEENSEKKNEEKQENDEFLSCNFWKINSDWRNFEDLVKDLA